jgi:hypothetical protein
MDALSTPCRPGMRSARVASTVLAVVIALSCSQGVGIGAPELSVVPARAEYPAAAPGAATVVAFTVRHAGGPAAWVARCGGTLTAYLERAGPRGAWREASRAAVVCPAHVSAAPVEVTPGAAWASTIVAPGAGRYRVRISFGSAFDRPAERTARSAPVTVR